ncbi:MAG: hypothetical protein QXN56_03835 [Candidatus Hadarchaeum sp.]
MCVLHVVILPVVLSVGLYGRNATAWARVSPQTTRVFLVTGDFFHPILGFTTVLVNFAVVNLVAFVVADEKRHNRSRLLRVADVDGGRAVASFLLFGVATAFALSVLAFAGPSCLGASLGVPLVTWANGVISVAVWSSATVPVALTVAYLLPRALVLLLLQAVAGVASAALIFTGESLAPQSGGALFAVTLHTLCLAVLAPVWRRTSWRLW